MEQKKLLTSKQITGIAVLLALVIVLQMLSGSMMIGQVQLNFSLIPIVLGSVIYGPIIGAMLGLACGIVVLVEVIMGGGLFYVIIWANDPVITVLICLVKTTVAGFLSGTLYKFISKKSNVAAIFVSSAIVPIVNTGLFILGCLCMNDTVLLFQTQLGQVSDFAHVIGMSPLVFILVILVTFNFFVELAINLILAPTLNRVLKIIKV